MHLSRCLADATAFRDSAPAEREAALAGLAEGLGDAWAVAPGTSEQSSATLVHRPTGLHFVAVSGGSFEMGLSSDDLAEAAEYVDFGTRVAAHLAMLQAAAQPVHRVRVLPFICSQRLLDARAVSSLSGGRLTHPTLRRADARQLAAGAGFRLPSEAELEWAARDGGVTRFTLDAARARELVENDDRRLPSCFGLRELNEGTWAEDDWHPNYAGAPSDSRPWLDGSEQGVVRGGFWLMAMQSEEELLQALAGLRHRGVNVARVRLALHLGELAADARA